MKNASLILLCAALAFGVGCGSDEEPEPVGGRSAALSGEIPSSDPGREDWSWSVWDVGEGDVSITISELGFDEELLELDCADFDGDGDLELDLTAGDAAVFVDPGGRVDVQSGEALVLLDGVTGDFEIAAGDASVAEALAAAAEAQALALAALGAIDVCGLPPEAAIELCFASIGAATACAETGAACEADVVVETATTACIASLASLLGGVEACLGSLPAGVSGYESYADYEDYGDYGI